MIYNIFAFLEKFNLAKRMSETSYLGHGDWYDGTRWWEVRVGGIVVRYDIDKEVFF